MKDLANTLLEVVITLAVKAGVLALTLFALNKAFDTNILNWRHVVLIICIALINALFPINVKVQKNDD